MSNRTHCIAFSDWSSQPKTELANGMRMDDNYYYWPGSWVQDRPGFMTGSGMPMRFADTDGTMIDVYQAATQMTDESDQSYPATIDTLLNNALGSTGYYGAFTVNFHTDASTEPQSDALVSSALSHNVPIVSGKQMTTWLDGRNASSYSNISWSANTLNFTVKVGTGANGLTGWCPSPGRTGLSSPASVRWERSWLYDGDRQGNGLRAVHGGRGDLCGDILGTSRHGNHCDVRRRGRQSGPGPRDPFVDHAGDGHQRGRGGDVEDRTDRQDGA